MQYVYVAIIFIFGAALGSFINVVADRYNTGLSFWKGRSFCFSCNHTLSKMDLFPIFSFLFLKGNCRYCQAKIPSTVLVVEILMGILSLVAAFKSGLLGFPIIHNSYFLIHIDFSLLLFANYLLLTAIFGTILLISVYDLRHFIIPDSFLVALFFFAFLHNSYFIILDSFNFYSYIVSLASGVLLALPFLAIFLFSKGRWIGFGDIKYIAVIGFFLGFAEGISAVVLAFWIGALISISILSLNKINSKINLLNRSNNLTIKSEIPFGPFLSLGILISFYFNADLFQIKTLINAF